jgi:hypothetical protein
MYLGTMVCADIALLWRGVNVACMKESSTCKKRKQEETQKVFYICIFLVLLDFVNSPHYCGYSTHFCVDFTHLCVDFTHFVGILKTHGNSY